MVSEPGGQGAPQKRQPPKRRPVIIRIFRSFKRHEHRRRRRAQQEKSDRDLIMARWTRRVGIFTAALVAVGVVTGLIFWRQLSEMHQATIDSDALVRTARETEERQLQAYVGIDGLMTLKCLNAYPAILEFRGHSL
jgi:hypothetical protein